MKNIFYSIFLLILTCQTPDNSKNGIDEKFETQFTNADILNIRKTPSLSSEIINQIPFGSKISTSNKNIQESYADKIHSWHFVKEANGFALDYFLQKNEIFPFLKKMELKSSYSYNQCNPYGIGTYKTISLHNNKTYYTDEFIDFDLGRKKIFNGNYQIKNDSISINLEEIETQSISYSDGIAKITEKNIPKEKKTNNIILFWKDSIKGFITDNQEKYLDSTLYNVDLKKCIFTNKKCKHYDPFGADCSGKFGKSGICDQIGYFCKR